MKNAELRMKNFRKRSTWVQTFGRRFALYEMIFRQAQWIMAVKNLTAFYSSAVRHNS